MATSPNSITLPHHEISARAAAELARASAGNTTRVHAFNKAAFMLAREGVEIIHSHDGFLIASVSRANMIHRVSHLHGCSCEAGQNGRFCWHQATIQVLERAGRYVMPTLPEVETAPLKAPTAQLITAERFARAKAAMDELSI
jgi:hypothetical protein